MYRCFIAADINEGDTVSLYVDIDSVCLRGSLPPYTFNRMYIGNGIAKYGRVAVYCGSNVLRYVIAS